MIKKKFMSQCISSDYCQGWNDAVDSIVRCKDCKHNVANWQHDENDGTDYTDIVCDYWMSDGLEPDKDFCSKGVRIDV